MLGIIIFSLKGRVPASIRVQTCEATIFSLSIRCKTDGYIILVIQSSLLQNLVLLKHLLLYEMESFIQWYLQILLIPSQLALPRWPNVGPTSNLTLGQRRHSDVGPTWICQLAQRWANIGPNVGATSHQWLYANVVPMAFLVMECDLIGCMFGCVDQWNISW